MIGHRTAVLRWTTAALIALVLAAVPLSARAGEPEGIRLTLDAPPECLVEHDLVAEVEALGVHPRVARDDERARTFAVTIAPDRDHYTARLVVHDLVGERTERSVASPRCSDAAKSVALLIALALDESAVTDADPVEPPALWPAPAADDAPTGGVRVIRAGPPGRKGSGGIAVTGLYGRSLPPDGGMHVAAVRTYAAARVSGNTRVGASLAYSSDTQREAIGNDTFYESSGWSGRAGAIIGWGAPWNDMVVGFVGEAGLAAGRQSGIASPSQAVPGVVRSSEACLGNQCFDTGRSVRSSIFFVAPFASASLVLQIPWKAPIRPIAGLTTTWIFGSERVTTMSFTGDVGLVWQAW